PGALAPDQVQADSRSLAYAVDEESAPEPEPADALVVNSAPSSTTLDSMGRAWNSPISPYGTETAAGQDPMTASGALLGDLDGESAGSAGFGLRGSGRGGGGTGEGAIGLGGL